MPSECLKSLLFIVAALARLVTAMRGQVDLEDAVKLTVPVNEMEQEPLADMPAELVQPELAKQPGREACTDRGRGYRFIGTDGLYASGASFYQAVGDGIELTEWMDMVRDFDAIVSEETMSAEGLRVASKTHAPCSEDSSAGIQYFEKYRIFTEFRDQACPGQKGTELGNAKAFEACSQVDDCDSVNCNNVNEKCRVMIKSTLQQKSAPGYTCWRRYHFTKKDMTRIYARASSKAWEWTRKWHKAGKFVGKRLDFERLVEGTDYPELHLRAFNWDQTPAPEKGPAGEDRVCCCEVIESPVRNPQCSDKDATWSDLVQDGALCCKWKRGKKCTGFFSTPLDMYVKSSYTTRSRHDKLIDENDESKERVYDSEYEGPLTTEVFCPEKGSTPTNGGIWNILK